MREKPKFEAEDGSRPTEVKARPGLESGFSPLQSPFSETPKPEPVSTQTTTSGHSVEVGQPLPPLQPEKVVQSDPQISAQELDRFVNGEPITSDNRNHPSVIGELYQASDQVADQAYRNLEKTKNQPERKVEQ